jgi:hypothetical protein
MHSIKVENISASIAVFLLFIYTREFHSRVFLFEKKGNRKMHLTLIKNPDESKIIIYKIARLVYAETLCSSLPVVEALVSMISNLCVTSKRELSDIIQDKTIFESLNNESLNHNRLMVDSNQNDFRICLRVVQRMLNGNLPDRCFGATRFHRNDVLPEWATSRGYIAEIDGLFFYL